MPRQVLAFSGASIGALLLTTGLIGLVPQPAAAALPTCAQLGTSASFGLVGNPNIIAGTLVTVIKPALPAKPPSFVPAPPIGGVSPSPTPATPAYCQVNFTFTSGLSGPRDGYDVGQQQKIKIQIVLPLNTADGGVTGSVPSSFDQGSTATTIQGNWIGKLLVSASGGTSGTLGWTPQAEGLNGGDQTYAIRLGYVGSATDTGQGNPPFVVIPSGPLANTLATGTILDWAFRGTHYGKELATTIAQTYYGVAPTRTYYNGGSGGGNEGLGQLMHFGDEYDGILRYRAGHLLGSAVDGPHVAGCRIQENGPTGRHDADRGSGGCTYTSRFRGLRWSRWGR